MAIWAIMNGRKHQFGALLAPVCSSFSSMNVGTSRRSAVTPWGNDFLQSVADGNMLMSRAVLLCLLVDTLGGVFVLEQPATSRIVWYPRFEWLHRQVEKVYMTAWWARHYMALTPKRHRAWSNCPHVAKLDRGKLSREARESCPIKTTVKQHKGPGKKAGYVGNKFLKKTQRLGRRN